MPHATHARDRIFVPTTLSAKRFTCGCKYAARNRAEAGSDKKAGHAARLMSKDVFDLALCIDAGRGGRALRSRLVATDDEGFAVTDEFPCFLGYRRYLGAAVPRCMRT